MTGVQTCALPILLTLNIDLKTNKILTTEDLLLKYSYTKEYIAEKLFNNDTLGVSFCLIGLAISAPDFFTALKILLVVVFLWLASPVASHLLCRLEVETNEDRGQYMNVHEKSLAQEREETAHAEEEQA